MTFIQEVVVAENVLIQCGHLETSWEKLFIGIRRMTGPGYYLYSDRFMGRVTNTGQWKEKFLGASDSEKRTAILDLRIMTMDGGERQATDTRDKVFALRGIASTAIADSIVVHYSQSIERIYIDFPKRLLALKKDLQLLSLVRQGQRQK